jgi:hypothetical protein
MEANKKSNSTADRELFVSRLLNAPGNLFGKYGQILSTLPTGGGPKVFQTQLIHGFKARRRVEPRDAWAGWNRL